MYFILSRQRICLTWKYTLVVIYKGNIQENIHSMNIFRNDSPQCSISKVSIINPEESGITLLSSLVGKQNKNGCSYNAQWDWY